MRLQFHGQVGPDQIDVLGRTCGVLAVDAVGRVNSSPNQDPDARQPIPSSGGIPGRFGDGLHMVPEAESFPITRSIGIGDIAQVIAEASPKDFKVDEIHSWGSANS